MLPVRLLPPACRPGPDQMAADDALLAAAAGGVAGLRFYTWPRPTASLGYFQPAADRRTNPAWAGLDWVRRPTGGAMLVHHHELTYAFALPPGRDWQPPGESWLCRAHHAITDVLRGFGVETAAVVCGRERKLGPALCFRHQTAGDLLAGGSKVVGSAQRKSAGALLQHGGILLAASPAAPELPGIAELTGVRLDPVTLTQALAAGFAAAFGWDLRPADWSAADETVMTEAAAKYRSDAWNDKR